MRASTIRGGRAIALAAIAATTAMVTTWGSIAAAGADLSNADWPPCPAGEATAAPDVPPTAPDLGPAFPPPPDSFDPAAIPFIGSLTAYPNYGEPPWAGNIDGSDLRCMAPAAYQVLMTADGEVLFLENEAESRSYYMLAIRRSDGQVRQLLSGSTGFVLAGGAEAAIATRRAGDRYAESRDRGVWRVPLDGSAPRRVIPGGEDRENSWLVTSWDGRSVATAVFVSSGLDPVPQPPMLVRFDGGPVRRLQPYAEPLGFDARGRLILFRGRVRAFDPRDGSSTPMSARGRTAYVTPRGRWIVVRPWQQQGQRRDRLITIRVRDGDRTEWTLAPGGWDIVDDLSSDRYIVLQDVSHPDRYTRIGVLDLREGWIGYLRFLPRPAVVEPPLSTPCADGQAGPRSALARAS